MYIPAAQTHACTFARLQLTSWLHAEGAGLSLMCVHVLSLFTGHQHDTVTQFTARSLAAAWFNFSKAKNKLLQVFLHAKANTNTFSHQQQGL